MDWHLVISWDYTCLDPVTGVEIIKPHKTRLSIGPELERKAENSIRYTWQKALSNVKNIIGFTYPRFGHQGATMTIGSDKIWNSFRAALMGYTSYWVENLAPAYLIEVEKELLMKQVKTKNPPKPRVQAL